MATGRVEIVKERCKSCGYCIKFCPKGVLAVGKEVNSKGYEVVYPANPENCIGFISEVFGMKYFSMNFPIMNCNLIFASFIATGTSILTGATGSYVAAFAVLLTLSLVAMILNLSLKRN